eukprot:755442-Hanusia_phi.AAC.8
MVVIRRRQVQLVVLNCQGFKPAPQYSRLFNKRHATINIARSSQIPAVNIYTSGHCSCIWTHLPTVHMTSAPPDLTKRSNLRQQRCNERDCGIEGVVVFEHVSLLGDALA